MIESSNTILSFTCDYAGRIDSVIRDDLDLLIDRVSPATLHDLVDEASIPKVWRFLEELFTHKAAADWTLNLSVKGRLQTLHFTGGALEKRFLVVASNDQENIPLYFEELMKIGNEHANALRAALKDNELLRRREDMPGHLYQELMALNNELTNTQRELAKKNFELGRLNREKNRFIGMVAHDLRTPLDVISGYSELLRDDWDTISSDERGGIVDSIADSVHYMLRLINDLLDYAKIESGTLQLNCQMTAVDAVLKASLDQVRPLAARKRIDVNIRGENPLPTVWMDRYRISQVVVNLLSNAIKFSPVGSVVTVDIGRDGDRLRVDVRDEGQGIPADELERLFNPFSQTSVKPTAGENSTGLGLLIVKRIVTAHNGEVSVRSTLGEGSVFSFLLPMEERACSSSES